MNYEYPPVGGGGGAACQDIAETLVSFGHEVDVVTTGRRGLACEECRRGVRIHRVACMRRHLDYVGTAEMLTEVLPAYRRAVAMHRRAPYDVNHTHFIVPTGLSSYLLWRKTRLPYVITLHGSDVPGYNPDRFQLTHTLIHPLWRRIVTASAGLVSPSRYLRDLFHESADPPVEIIPNGVNFPAPPEGCKRNRILLVTRMFERKGVQHFLRALEGLRIGWEVLIAGDGPYLPTLREMAKRVSTPITFLGFIRGEQLRELYHSARIFVFPSVKENFPVVLLEAMGAGCAVITTNAHGCAEVVEDAAIRVAPGDAEALRSALEKLLVDDREIDRLAHLAQQRVARFSSEFVSRRYEEFLARFNGRGRARVR
jgi:glycosyltransferase involved in cell wall biosynthesis